MIPSLIMIIEAYITDVFEFLLNFLRNDFSPSISIRLPIAKLCFDLNKILFMNLNGWDWDRKWLH
nr:hypothetical protein Itr_chr07CG10960 [Ipomoea trifida]GLL44454.1 hypothetical protein Itr_chr13CG10690 [Ipomoea trifida]GLL44455.1 hypothetical protein Itr_chr13CG10700 [Ipomoea trifida]GLL46445.1 hypothetical protein Itr_chr14CG11210 [Ipomoea trifida]